MRGEEGLGFLDDLIVHALLGQAGDEGVLLVGVVGDRRGERGRSDRVREDGDEQTDESQCREHRCASDETPPRAGREGDPGGVDYLGSMCGDSAADRAAYVRVR
jgi:hypothetical protein